MKKKRKLVDELMEGIDAMQQQRITGGAEVMNSNDSAHPSDNTAGQRYRHKPLYQSRVVIPRAMTEEPEKDAICYYPETDGFIRELKWGWQGYHFRLLKAGFLYTTEADAQARLNAMLMTEE